MRLVISDSGAAVSPAAGGLVTGVAPAGKVTNRSNELATRAASTARAFSVSGLGAAGEFNVNA
jgi:hypothetical protein